GPYGALGAGRAGVALRPLRACGPGVTRVALVALRAGGPGRPDRPLRAGRAGVALRPLRACGPGGSLWALGPGLAPGDRDLRRPAAVAGARVDHAQVADVLLVAAVNSPTRV